MKKTFLTLMAALAMVGCVKNELEAPVAPELGFEPEDLVATLEGGDTKTHIDSYGSVLWSEGDRITVLYSGTDLALTYVLKEDSINKTKGNFIYDSNSGWFSTTLPAIPGEATQKYDKFYGVYPPYGYTESRPVLLDKDGQLQVTIPAEQHYTKLVDQVSFDRDAAVMTGASGDINGIQFKNATGLLKVFLYLVDGDNNPVAKSGVPPINRVESITVSSNAHLLAGPAYINASAAAVIKEDGANSATLRCYDADDNPIVLDASETYTTKGGVTFDGNAFILALPPTAFVGGEELEIVIKMEDVNGVKSTLHKTITIPDKGFKILRSAISTIPVYYTLAEIEANIENRAAKIGDNYYETLADALAAVPTDGTPTTIKLVGDSELTTTLTTAYGQKIVLDLNGHNIKSSTTAIKNLGDLEVVGEGSITVSGTSTSTYGISNAGAAGKFANLVIGENVSITAPSTAVYTGYAKTTVNGTLANTQSSSSNIYSTLRLAQYSSEVVVAESAKVSGVGNAIYGANGKLEVYSTNVGKIYADGSATAGLKIKKTAAIEGLNVYGHAEFSDVADYYVAAKALSACTGTVKLLSDINNATLAVSKGKTVILNLNGHQVAAETYPIKVEGNLTITGEGTVQSTGMGSNTSVQAAVYALKDGKVTILDGNFVAGYIGAEGNPAVYVRDNAEVYIQGGDFVGSPKFLLNKLDSSIETSVIEVSGGTFHNNFNPADNAADGEHTNFVAEGYESNEIEPGVWTVSSLQ